MLRHQIKLGPRYSYDIKVRKLHKSSFFGCRIKAQWAQVVVIKYILFVAISPPLLQPLTDNDLKVSDIHGPI